MLELWRGVVDPDGVGMPDGIAADIASYTGEPVSVVLEKMSRAKHELKRLWEETSVDTSDAASVRSFYRDQFVEAYELADWHCGRENGVPPLNYAGAALFARRKGLCRVLDFGSGIGTGSLCLAEVGCEVHAADVARQLLDFVRHRFARRQRSIRVFDLAAGERPAANHYDLITCFDVLEHIPDQLATLRELASYLRKGGYLFVTLMEDSSHPDRPMHISSAGDVLSLVRRTTLRPVWSHCHGDTMVLMRSRAGRLHSHIASWVDHVQRRASGRHAR